MKASRLPTVVEHMVETCDSMGEVSLGGIKLETADAALLDVSQFDIDTHVAVQPSAVAYYGSLKKEAARRLAALKRAIDRWEKKQWAKAKASLGAGTGKVNLADIDARFVVDNEADILNWERQLEQAQLEFDTLDVWFEAWRAKAYTIHEFAQVDRTERYTPGPHLSGEERQGGREFGTIDTKRIKGIIRDRIEREQSLGKGTSKA